MTVIGALIMGVFATIWWIVGLRAAGHGALLVYPLPLVIALVLAAAATRLTRRESPPPGPPTDAEHARRDRLVAWASAAEGVALFLVAGVILPSTNHREATAPAIALIVGAHFIPLARGLPARAYYATAATLIALGLIGFAIVDPPARITVVSAGAAVVLWLTAATALRASVGHLQPDVERDRAVSGRR